MKIKKYTIELTWSEMYDLASALEHYIESNLTLNTDPKRDEFLNDFETECGLLNEFINSCGYTLSVSEKTIEGYCKGISGKIYQNAEDWLKALLKQRRKEYKEFNKK